MEDDPGHKAMLYYLEVLMNTTDVRARSISQLAGRFGNKTFTPEMRSAAGGNERGLRKFFLRYPSLFKVDGNLVSLNDSGTPSIGYSGSPPSTPTSGSTMTGSNTLTDLHVETDAVLYFQNRLAKKDEKWVQIKSLAGHLSQASFEIRNCVGPQNEFLKFLTKHPHVFEVQGELVSLRDSFSSANYKKDIGICSSSSRPNRPKNLKFATRSHSSPISGLDQQSSGTTPTVLTPNKLHPLTMTANEYKAVMFIKGIIEKIGNLEIQSLTGHFSQAPENIRKTIGYTTLELEEFLKNHDTMFTLDDEGVVKLKSTPKLHVIITGSKPGDGRNVQTLTNRRGRIFHVAKLWGIVDLGKHEHVFFDRSIYHKQIEDFQAEFRVGEFLNFNAILAPCESRAKWKATHIWHDGEIHPDIGAILVDGITSRAASPSESMEDEICRLLPDDFEISKQLKDDPFPDVTPSGDAMNISWNTEAFISPRSKSTSSNAGPGSRMSYNYDKSIAVEDLQNKYTELPKDMNSLKIGVDDATESIRSYRNTSGNSVSTEERPCSRTVSCQTISTGEVMATQLYHDGPLFEVASLSVIESSSLPFESQKFQTDI